MNHAVAVAAEFGLPLKWPRDYLPSEALVEYHFERSNEQKPLLFSQLSLTSQFWAGGMTVAVLALAYEMVMAKGQNIKHSLGVNKLPRTQLDTFL